MKLWPTLGVRTADLTPLIDVHEHVRTEIVPGPLAEKLAADLATHRVDHTKLRHLGRDYGRASRTIHSLRAEAALLREEIGALNEVISEGEEVIGELQGALDRNRPGPDANVLGEQLKTAWFRPRAQAVDIDQRWTQVAETAIDAVRGLWPALTPGVGDAGKSPGVAGERTPGGEPVPGPPRTRPEAAGDDTPLAEWEIAALDAEASAVLDGRFRATWPNESAPTNVAGGSEAADPPAAAPRGGEPPAPGDTLRDNRGHWHRCPVLDTAHIPGTAGATVPCRRCQPADDLNLAELADHHREQLAQVIASADLDLTGGRWATTHDHLRAYYLGRADAVVLAGWRPPLAGTGSLPTTTSNGARP